MAEGIARARDAFDRQAWGRAYADLSAAARDEPLEIDDLRLACAAYLVGRNDESSEVWARASQECARIGEVARAARFGFWLAFAFLNSGELAKGGRWVDRAQRLLNDRRIECVERGHLRYASGLCSEAMVAVAAPEISPIAVGDAYFEEEISTSGVSSHRSIARVALRSVVPASGTVDTHPASTRDAAPLAPLFCQTSSSRSAAPGSGRPARRLVRRTTIRVRKPGRTTAHPTAPDSAGSMYSCS